MRGTGSYKHSLALLLTAAAVLPLLSFGLTAIGLLSGEIKSQADKQDRRLAVSLAANIENSLLYAGNEIKTVALAVQAGDGLFDPERLNAFLSSVTRGHAIIESIRIVDSQGVVVLSSIAGDQLLGLSLDRHPAIVGVQTRATPFWSSPYLSDLDHRVAMTVSLSFPRGVVLGYIRLHGLNELIEKLHRSPDENELIFITDESGALLAHPNEELVLQRVNMSHLDIVRLGKKQAGGSMVFDLEGVAYLGRAVRITQTNWLVVVAQPLSKAHALSRRIQVFLVLGVIVALLGALVISVGASRRLLRPVLNLAAYTQKIARGDYGSEPPMDHKYAETMSLSTAFTAMTRAVGQREASLVESEKKYSGLLERMNEAVYRFSVPEGLCEYISPACPSVFGYSREAFWKAPFLLRQIIHPESKSWFEAQWQKIKQGNLAPFFEYRIIDADQQSRWIYQTNAAVLDDKGRIIAVECCCNDITARREAEQELETYHLRLEELVKARTNDLRAAQEELIKKEKLAVLGRLTATVSHELRNPLGVIRSSCYYLGRVLSTADPKIRKHIERIDEQTKICDVIVADLLEFTRGRISQTTPGDLNRLINDTLDVMVVPDNVRLIRNLAEDLPPVAIDKEKMRSVLHNLVANAMQAVTEKMDDHAAGRAPDHPAITIKTALEDMAVLIVIEDNGVGMEPDVLARVFEPLYTTRARGTGLGLAIVHKIVKEHHGRVDIRSRVGVGTCVTITLHSGTRH